MKKKRFMELTRPHLKLLYNLALRYTSSPSDAEDLVQETMHNAFKSFGQLKDQGSIKAWLISIMRNRFLRDAQKKWRVDEVELDDGRSYLSSIESATEGPEDLLVFKLESTRLQAIIDRLPEKNRSAILLSCMEGLTYMEISEALDIPVGTVMSSISRGKAYIKNELLRLAKQDTSSVLSIKGRLKEKG